MSLFKGLSAFPITPSDAEGRVQVEDLQGIVGRLVEARVDSIGLLGSTGTYAYLTRDERRRAIEAAVERVDGAVPIMVGIGATTTAEVIRLGKDAAKAGADGVLLAPVSYLPLTEEEVADHYSTVAAAIELPLCIYDNPTVTRFSFTRALIARLSRVPGIEAVKTGAPEAERAAFEVSQLREEVSPGFSVGYSADWRMTEAMIAGADAWYSVLAGTFPRPCQAIIEAVNAGDHQAARDHHLRLTPLWDLFAELSSFRVIYAANNLLNRSQAQPPRPLLGLSAENRRRLAAVMEQLGLLDDR